MAPIMLTMPWWSEFTLAANLGKVVASSAHVASRCPRAPQRRRSSKLTSMASSGQVLRRGACGRNNAQWLLVPTCKAHPQVPTKRAAFRLLTHPIVSRKQSAASGTKAQKQDGRGFAAHRTDQCAQVPAGALASAGRGDPSWPQREPRAAPEAASMATRSALNPLCLLLGGCVVRWCFASFQEVVSTQRTTRTAKTHLANWTIASKQQSKAHVPHTAWHLFSR